MRHIQLGNCDYINSDVCTDLIKIGITENIGGVHSVHSGLILYISGILVSKKDFDALVEDIKNDFPFLTDEDIQYSFVTNCSSDNHLNGYSVISFHIPKGLTLAEDVIITDTIDFNY